MTFGDKLKKLRMTSDFSKEELAEKLSVSKGEINNWENGITEPDYETVKKISAIFGMSTDYFYKEDTVIGSSYSELYNRYNSRHLNKKIKTTIIVFLIIGVISAPFSTAISFYQAFGSNGYIYVLIFEVLLTTTLFIFALRRVLKARYKEDLIAWGIVSLIFISFIAGLIMLLVKDDKDFTVGTVTKNESTPPNLPYGSPETLIKRANDLFIEGRYDAAYRNYLNANRLLGGHNSNCLERMIRCKTNNLCFIPKDPELLYAIASKREYVTSPVVIDYIDRVKVLIETSYKNAISYINDGEYAKAYDELKYVRPNYLNTKELLAECNKHIKYEAEYKAALNNISNKKYFKAVSILKKLNGYKDSNELIKEYSSKETKKVVITLSFVVSALIVALAIVSIPIYVLPEVKYSRALKLRDSNKTQELDTLMINLSKRELKFFRDKQHKYGHTYFEANGNIYEYCLGTSLNVTVVIIPDNCRVICNYAYSGCINLKTIEIPDGVELVGKNAFNMCQIEEAKLPSHLTDSIPKDNLNKLIISSGDTIKANAFKNSPKLSTIYISKSVTTIGKNAFANCPISYASIPSVAINSIPKEKLAVVEIISGTEIEDSAFNKCSKLSKITICDEINKIGNRAFSECEYLEYIELPDSITTIGSYAFNNSIRIRRFTVPDGVKRIENYTFANNYNIDIIDLGHVQYIGKYALGKCGSIRTVVLPKELEVIDENAFANTVVYNVYFKGNKSEWDGIEIKSGNDTLSNIVYLYSETKPNVAGHYWHYVDGVITTWP